MSINNSVGSVLGSASRAVSPTTTTTYTLTAANSAGSVTRTVTVTVTPAVVAPVIGSFDGHTRFDHLRSVCNPSLDPLRRSADNIEYQQQRGQRPGFKFADIIAHSNDNLHPNRFQ